jgi:hypothetical protein
MPRSLVAAHHDLGPGRHVEARDATKITAESDAAG